MTRLRIELDKALSELSLKQNGKVFSVDLAKLRIGGEGSFSGGTHHGSSEENREGTLSSGLRELRIPGPGEDGEGKGIDRAIRPPEELLE